MQHRQQVELEAVSPNGMNWIHYNILEYIKPLNIAQNTYTDNVVKAAYGAKIDVNNTL